MSVLTLPKPYLLFLGATTNPVLAKTAFGLKDWAGEDCVAEWTLPGASVTTGLPHMDPRAATAATKRTRYLVRSMLSRATASIGPMLPARTDSGRSWNEPCLRNLVVKPA